MNTENTYVQTFGNMWVTSLTQEAHERTCGYWFTVTANALAHTAFRTREELDKWLAERGLALAPLGWRWEDHQQVDCPLAEPGTWSSVQVIGTYRRVSHRDVAQFDALEPLLVTTTLDNGEWVPAKITEADGIRSVHYVNINHRVPEGLGLLMNPASRQVIRELMAAIKSADREELEYYGDTPSVGIYRKAIVDALERVAR